MCNKFYSSFIHNNPRLEITEMSNNSEWIKGTVFILSNATLKLLHETLFINLTNIWLSKIFTHKRVYNTWFYLYVFQKQAKLIYDDRGQIIGYFWECWQRGQEEVLQYWAYFISWFGLWYMGVYIFINIYTIKLCALYFI